MSARMPNPDSSVASTPSATMRSPTRSRIAFATAAPATAAVPCPIASTCVIVPSASRARTASGSPVAGRRTRRRPSSSATLPRSVLRNEIGRFRDLLQQEVREVAAVDVARRDLRVLEIVGAHRQRRAVVGEPADAVELTGARGVDHHHLTARRRRALGIGRRLAVEPQVGARLLDHAVGLARDDEHVLREPDVERLTAATQREVQATWCIGHRRADRHRTLERGDRGAERIVGRAPGRQSARHERGDHLRVGGDLGRGVEGFGHFEIGVVVDVAVECADDQRRVTRAVRLLVVERVRIRLGDDADARPARVAEDHGVGGVGGDRKVQQLVVADRGAQHRGVVAELADLGRGLVHERERVSRTPHCARREQRIGHAGLRGAGRPRGRRRRGRGRAPSRAGRRSRARAPRGGRSPTARPGSR